MNLLGIASPEEEAEAMRRKLLEAGVTEDDLAGAKRQKAAALVDGRSPAEAVTSLLSPGMAAPMTPQQQAEEKYGKGGTMLRMLGTMLTGGLLGGVLLPEASKGNKAQYKSDLELYNKQRESQLALQAAQAERDRMSGLGAGLRDAFGTETPDDDLEAVMNARIGGMDLADIKHFQNMVGQSYQDPKWETKFDNGILVKYDVNGKLPAQPVLGDDGNPITEKMDGDMRKTSAWFERAVPALENMHKLEDRGVTLSREVLTLMQQAQDADGIFQPQIYNKLINDLNLSKDQKQYLRNAQDLAMIQLRKESGAAIGVQEMYNELSQNVMLDDMSDEGYEYQRGKARLNKYRGLANGLPDYLLNEFKKEGYFDTLDNLRRNSSRNTGPYDYTGLSDSDFDEIYERIEPGTVFIGPDGKEYRK